MKKALLVLLTLMLLQIPAFSSNKKMPPSTSTNNPLPNIFIYTIPDEKPDQTQQKEDEQKYINNNSNNEKSEDEILLNMKYEADDETVLGATVLKGYAEYLEDSEEIYLKDDNNNFVLNLKVPQKITGSEGLNLIPATKKNKMTKYTDSEYTIAPKSVNASSSKGNFTFGALYGDEVDSIAMLESEAGLFTKYEKNKFALSTTYKKNLNTLYSQYYDTISVAPEFKLNNFMSIKNEYKADITRNRKSGALIFSFNPLGKKDSDRMRLELGAKQTIYADNTTPKTEFSFSTKFKL